VKTRAYESIMDDVDDVQKVLPRSEALILKRARMLYWSNTALAALTPPQSPIKRVIAGTEYTAVLLKELLDGFIDVVKTMRDDGAAMRVKKSALAKYDKAVDQLIKRWYKSAKAAAEPASDLEGAPWNVPTEERTPASEPI
jgi:hypothetical protein